MECMYSWADPLFCCSWWWGTLMIPPTCLSGEASICWCRIIWRLKNVTGTLCPSASHTIPGYKCSIYFRPVKPSESPVAFFEPKSLYCFVPQPNDVRSLGYHVWTLQRCPDFPGESRKDWTSGCGGMDTFGWDLSCCCQYRISFYLIKNSLSLISLFKVVLCAKGYFIYKRSYWILCTNVT